MAVFAKPSDIPIAGLDVEDPSLTPNDTLCVTGYAFLGLIVLFWDINCVFLLVSSSPVNLKAFGYPALVCFFYRINYDLRSALSAGLLEFFFPLIFLDRGLSSFEWAQDDSLLEISRKYYLWSRSFRFCYWETNLELPAISAAPWEEKVFSLALVSKWAVLIRGEAEPVSRCKISALLS